jgi:PAS domain S-box-containing protein
MDDLAAARQEYLKGEPAPEGVRPVVLSSWERCRAYGVDPRHMRLQAPDPARLSEARERNHMLLESAEAFLQLAHAALSDQPHLFALSDRDGLVLRIITGPGLPENELEQARLVEGASWHERDIGCNGVGTCLATGEPVILIGPEHYQESYVGWTCIGVPIRSDDEIVGVLDLSVPNEHTHVHTWGWMLSLAKGIEASLARETSGGRIRVERVVVDLEAPFNGVRGVFELLASQIELPPTHAGFLEAARSKLDEAEVLVRTTVARLHESEERLRRIAESGMVGLLFWEIGGRISYANDRFLEMVGYSRADLDAGRIDWRAMTPPEWAAKDRAAIEQLQAVGASTPFEKEFVRRDGTRVSVLLSAARFSDTTERGVTLVLDITERKYAERERERLLQAEHAARAEAEEANRAKMDFLSAMSHELRTPLNAIGGYVELLDMGIHGPVTESQQTALSRITANQRHLLILINDILVFAKLEAGQVEFDLRSLSVRRLLLSVEPLVAPSAAAKGIAYSVQERDTDLVLLGDEERVRQIVLNLVTNAIKFTEEGGWVLLSYDADAEFVRIRVSDNGSGIAPEKHQAIFDPFVQVDRRLNRRREGVGLGLAISRDFARAMNGELSVESNPGAGSTFSLTLPRGPAE